MMNRQPYRQRPMNPLPGIWVKPANVPGYWHASPNGDGGKRTRTHMRGRRWLHTPTTAHCSLFTAHWTYTFSAKERDPETGLSYFGSRYYSSDLSIWLSVDPMSDKYPSLSPYVYCADNPVKLVDPNGEEVTSPDGWIVNNTNKTLIWVNNMGGDMCQYVGGVVTSFKSRSDFINEYASNGYQIIIEDNTKPGLSTGTSLSQDSPSSTSDYSKSLWEQHLAHTVPLLVDSLVVLSLDFGDLKWALNLESTSIIRSIRNDFLH